MSEGHELILHDYELSPFSEKIRKIFAMAGIPWSRVNQPIIAPKPDLTPLTGGYRRIPVLQIGADVYCDTSLIAARVAEDYPDAGILPAGQGGVAEIVAQWADHTLFQIAVPLGIEPLMSVLPDGFLEDRAKLSPGFSREALAAGGPVAREQLPAILEWLESQLSESEFLLGDTFSVADAACFHPIWFLRANREAFEVLRSKPALSAWFDRIESAGWGDSSELDPSTALDIAAACEPVALADPVSWSGPERGLEVGVRAADYGPETSEGVLVFADSKKVVIRREGERCGRVHVHFPRAGYRIQVV